jgi:ABC-2 type transport system permease protein
MTPIIEILRSLLTDGTGGSEAWVALAWILGILAISYALALNIYSRREPITAGQ